MGYLCTCEPIVSIGSIVNLSSVKIENTGSVMALNVLPCKY